MTLADLFEFRYRVWSHAPSVDEWADYCVGKTGYLRTMDEAAKLAKEEIRREIAEGKPVSEGLRRLVGE